MCIYCDPDKYTAECDLCGVKGCRQCLEHWSGKVELETGYHDDRWVCMVCLSEVETERKLGDL